jgi:adenylylsulfate kinase-like enzyme
MKNAAIFWFTGLSGTGKTTLSLHAKGKLEAGGLTVMILDGDTIRASYKVKLGFNKEDIKKNNMNIVNACKTQRENYDILMVPVISPLDRYRKMARKILEPSFHLIHLSSSIDSLKNRDPKGLYNKADKGEIKDLIGYSKSNSYEIPTDADLILDTSSDATFELSVETIVEFVKNNSNNKNVISK